MTNFDKIFSDPKRYTQGNYQDNEDFVCKQIIHRKLDYIAVAGAAITTRLDEVKNFFRHIRDVKDLTYNDYQGNDYRFINQALRAINNFKITDRELSHKILIVFQYGYTDNDKNRIKEYANNAGAEVIYINNVQQFINFLNNEKEKYCRKIKTIEIFSHGIIDSLEFHYNAPLEFKDDRGTLSIPNKMIQGEEQGNFSRLSVDKINKDIFTSDAEIKSYACRTGISVDKENFISNKEAKPEESLAQYMANQLKVTVWAFQTRSDYAQTYDRNRSISDEEWKEIKRNMESNDKDNDGPIMPEGSLNEPISGNTPTGDLKYGLQKYTPK